MTAKKERPARRGRKPAPADQRTEPFSIRLTPKLRYGVELLGRAQRGKSLSQVVEWAIQRGLNSVSLTGDLSLGDALDVLWLEKTEWERIAWLYSEAPELLDFSERAICQTVIESREYRRFFDNGSPLYQDAETEDEAEAIQERADTEFNKFISTHWEQLKQIIGDRDAQGKKAEGVSLTDLLGVDGVAFASLEVLERYNRGEPLWLDPSH